MPLEFRIRFRVLRRSTQLGELAGIAARCENESIVVTRQLLADCLQESVGSERGETPFAVRMTSPRLMQLVARPRRDDELCLVNTEFFDADGLGLATEHPYKLRKRPPLLVAVAELFRGSAWKGHLPVSDVGLVDAAISRMAEEVPGETRLRLTRRT